MKLHVISGFLGSGKTTFIRKMMSHLKGNVAVIENEFGDVSIDHLAFDNVYVKEIYSGCVCCSLVGDLSRAIEEIYTHYQPEHIIIEPSGVASLSELLKSVRRVVSSFEYLSMGELITLVDCDNFKDYSENFGGFYWDQIKYAKKVVLSHGRDKECVQTVRLSILQELDGVMVSDTRWHKDEEAFKEVLIKQSAKPANPKDEKHENISLSSYTIMPVGTKEILNPVDFEKALKGNAFGQVYRVKGFVDKDDCSSIQINYVRGKLELNTVERQSTALVFIGEMLNQEAIEAYFNNSNTIYRFNTV